MATKTVNVGSAVGLHARPAALIAQAATAAGTAVTLAKPDGTPVDAGSALLIMTLGAKQGDAVVVESDDETLVDQIASLIEQDLDAQQPA
ncbi:HPr family phosphocarrier protein [Aeromicrobium chenweiae]|uniref:Phosphocarrier protein HPr n=1 Tax=Aeromicrobium chenweiae TaxID=2079793 RepID=A0A2S0WK44_9ACTN|nr:HPr family phosphocarrier protein [Aeromicrobium chenweiae]AWB91701.1 HPr family phosphocarrier protein [Aeromicrobium chenweiae]TGN32542.1 HPr family phosphocarrier protein [Aeromicrobium chenweiae]